MKPNCIHTIVVDLDGTLTFTDTLHESLIQLLRDRPYYLFLLPIWLLKGKAYFKARVTNLSKINPSLLPFNQQILAWLKIKKAENYRIVLCTAADYRIANGVAEHLGIFDEVMASNGKTNLAGHQKRTTLEQAFGYGGYAYVGNSYADIEVWKGASTAIVVNASNAVLKLARNTTQVELIIPPAPISIAAWTKVLRVHQWVKNLLLFVPLLAAHQISNFQSLTEVMFAFVSFCTCASCVYIINDLLDVESDRQHPSKCKRPFASGLIPVKFGILIVPFLATVSFFFATFTGGSFFGWLITYFVLTTAYTLFLKRYALVDCLTLAGLYTMRIVAGAAAISVLLSFWLLAFSAFIFLSLAFVKRYTELQVQGSNGKMKAHGRGYLVSDAPMMQIQGVTAGYAAVLVLALYINSESVVHLYTQPQIIWLAVPLALFWISWIWLKAQRNEMHDDPIIFALKDRSSWVVGLTMLIVFLLAGPVQ